MVNEMNQEEHGESNFFPFFKFQTITGVQMFWIHGLFLYCFSQSYKGVHHPDTVHFKAHFFPYECQLPHYYLLKKDFPPPFGLLRHLGKILNDYKYRSLSELLNLFH